MYCLFQIRLWISYYRMGHGPNGPFRMLVSELVVSSWAFSLDSSVDTCDLMGFHSPAGIFAFLVPACGH